MSRINEEDLDLEALVRVGSVTGQEHSCASKAAEILRESTNADRIEYFDVPFATAASAPDFPGVETDHESFPGVYAEVVGDAAGDAVLLVGHLDVVPPGDPDLWSSPPFHPRREGSLMFGRGTCDMKGGVSAAIAAFRRVAARPRSAVRGKLMLLLVSGEEDGGAGCAAAIRHLRLRASHCVLPEPTVLSRDSSPSGSAADPAPPCLVVAHAGSMTLTVTVRGRAAHASSRLGGRCALLLFRTVHDALLREEARVNADVPNPRMAALGLPYPTCVGKVRGGDWASSVMDTVVAEVRCGVCVGETVEEARARTRAAVHEACAGDEWLAAHPPTVEATGGRFEAAETPEDAPIVAAVQRAHTAEFGCAPHIAAVPYGCDMRLVSALAGAQCVVYGPGRVAEAHAVDECVSVPQVVAVANVLLRAVDAFVAV